MELNGKTLLRFFGAWTNMQDVLNHVKKLHFKLQSVNTDLPASEAPQWQQIYQLLQQTKKRVHQDMQCEDDKKVLLACVAEWVVLCTLLWQKHWINVVVDDDIRRNFTNLKCCPNGSARCAQLSWLSCWLICIQISYPHSMSEAHSFNTTFRSIMCVFCQMINQNRKFFVVMGKKYIKPSDRLSINSLIFCAPMYDYVAEEIATKGPAVAPWCECQNGRGDLIVPTQPLPAKCWCHARNTTAPNMRHHCDFLFSSRATFLLPMMNSLLQKPKLQCSSIKYFPLADALPCLNRTQASGATCMVNMHQWHFF